MLRFPHGMRPSTLDERRVFYRHDFDSRSLDRWIGDRKRQMKFAMILGRHTGIYLPEHAKNRNDVIVIDDWNNAADLRSYAFDYLPESMYYDRNRYVDVRDCAKCGSRKSACPRCYNYCGQQLAFDLDPENVDCPYHGHIGQKIEKGRGLSFCMFEFRAVRRQAIQLSDELQKYFEKVGVVYSGRGFHVVVDDEKAYELSRKERTALARRFGRRYAIDEWVTIGESRLMRLPFSLNALVSRKCIIMKDERDLLRFDPRTSAAVLPKYLRSA